MNKYISKFLNRYRVDKQSSSRSGIFNFLFDQFEILNGMDNFPDNRYEDIAYKLAIVATCINACINASLVPELKIYEPGLDREGKKKELPPDHELYEFIEQPNFFQDYIDFHRYTIGYYKLRGEIIWAFMDDPIKKDLFPRSKFNKSVFILSPADVKIIPDNKKRISHIEYSPEAGKTLVIPYDRIIYRRDFNPLNSNKDKIRGFGSGAGSLDMNILNHANIANNNIFKKGFQPNKFVFETDQMLNDENFKRLASELKDKYEGSEKFNKIMLLYAGLKVRDITKSPRDMDFKNLADMTERHIMGIYGVPPIYAQHWASTHYQNADKQEDVFYRNNIMPMNNDVSWAYDQIFPKINKKYIGYYTEYDYSGVPALINLQKLKIGMARNLFDMGVPPYIAFKRAGVDIERYKDDDVSFMQSNISTTDQIVAEIDKLRQEIDIMRSEPNGGGEPDAEEQ